MRLERRNFSVSGKEFCNRQNKRNRQTVRVGIGDSIKITNNGKKKTEIFQIEQPVLPFEEF